MKMNSLKTAAAIGLSALAIGSAAAQSDPTVSRPVGYETLNYENGFNFLGLRLHQAPVTSGVIASVGATSITVTGADFDALLDSSIEYVLEIESANGVIQVINAWSGETITTPSDLSAEIVAGTTSFTIRPVDTLASAFGNTLADVSFATGSGGPGQGDQVWLSDGNGGFDRYYFDTAAPPNFNVASWAIVDPDNPSGFGAEAVDGASINLVYSDGVIVFSQGAGGSTVITGNVKLSSTELAITNGFNFLSSVAPAGATLETAFGDSVETAALATSGGGPGQADQVWIPQDGTGDFDRYYFDVTAPPLFTEASWAIVDPDNPSGFGAEAIDGSTISLPSGFIILANSGGNVTQGVPSFYSDL